MARKRRILTPHLLRHVLSRGNGKMQIFLDDGDYIRFLGLLEEVVDKFCIECWSYCIMPNHYHLAMYPTLPNISAAMRELNGEYAKYWNRRHGRVGHVVQGRFKGQIVDTGEYLLTLYRYIARNPVRAGLVRAPEDWPWSSYAATLGLAPRPAFLRVDRVLGLFGTDPIVAARRYSAYVLSPHADAAAEDRIRSNAVILGGTSFKQRVLAELPSPPLATPEIESIAPDQGVALASGESTGHLLA